MIGARIIDQMNDEIRLPSELPKISIIVPVYNAEKYINRCLDSILGQNYENIELVMVDDGSTDGSSDICKHYCESDVRCRYFYQNNGGPDAARREGLIRSCGDYVVFVDADDYIKQDMVRTLYKVALEHNANVVCCEIERFSDSGRIWDESRKVDALTVFESVPEKMSAFFESRVLQGSYCAKLIRREVLSGYRYTDNTVIGEDISAILHIAQQEQSIVMIPDAYYRYYWNMDSISHSAYTDRHKSSLKNYVDICSELAEKHYIDDRSVYGFFAEREMAVATAMSRGRTYDAEAVVMLRDHLKRIWRYVRKNKYTALYMKVCIGLYIISPRMFIGLYRIVYLLTGR